MIKALIIIANSVRRIYNLPFVFLSIIANIYSNFLKVLDVKNYDTFWEELQQSNVDKKISKFIKISENKKIKFYTNAKGRFHGNSFGKEEDGIKGTDFNS